MGCQAPSGDWYSAVSPVLRVCSMKTSCTSAPRLVKPQATWALWPTMMKGTPGRETPVTWNSPVAVGASRSAWYQMPGTLWLRCMSFERRGLPVAVWAPETTQLLEPGMHSSQRVSFRDCWRARRSWVVAVGRWLVEGVRFALCANDPLMRWDLMNWALGFVGSVGFVSLVWDSSRGMSGISSWGAVRSMVGWVGGWSRQDPVGKRSAMSSGESLAARASRLSFCGKLVVRSWKRTRPTVMVSRGVQGAG